MPVQPESNWVTLPQPKAVTDCVAAGTVDRSAGAGRPVLRGMGDVQLHRKRPFSGWLLQPLAARNYYIGNVAAATGQNPILTVLN